MKQTQAQNFNTKKVFVGKEKKCYQVVMLSAKEESSMYQKRCVNTYDTIP